MSFHIGVCVENGKGRGDVAGQSSKYEPTMPSGVEVSNFFFAKILLRYYFLYNSESPLSILFYNLLYLEHFHMPLNIILQQHASIHAAQTRSWLFTCMSPVRL